MLREDGQTRSLTLLATTLCAAANTSASRCEAVTGVVIERESVAPASRSDPEPLRPAPVNGWFIARFISPGYGTET